MTLQLASSAAPEAFAAPGAAAPRFDPYHPFRRALLTPERVRTLSALRPARVVAERHPESDAQRPVTYTTNRLERLFIAPMHMNYHAPHHVWVASRTTTCRKPTV